MILLQAISKDGGLSASYTIVLLFGIVGSLLLILGGVMTKHFIGLLDALTKRVEKSEVSIGEIQKRNIQKDAVFEFVKNDNAQKLDMILAKLNID